MKKILPAVLSLFLVSACAVKNPANLVQENEVERLIRTLSADDMQGRATFTPGIEKAAAFIAAEFQKAGLQPLAGAENFRQEFEMVRVKPSNQAVTIDGELLADDLVFAIAETASVNWTENSGVDMMLIKPGENFIERYRAIINSEKEALVLVDASHADAFKRFHRSVRRGKILEEIAKNPAQVFILGYTQASTFKIEITNTVENLKLANVAGMLPGRSKKEELVIFSGHYDHIGIQKGQADSIANGADDDASGVTAVIALANYYRQINNNERTLIFVAFTAEEIGGFGSRYFSRQLNPESAVAMFNIEMIGKQSKFGANSAFITGYEKSDFGSILQQNLDGTEFTFHPDPYPSQNLFYRSDNATLAALGVPAHTISTVQIDTDKFYHTPGDEFETLNAGNITATIKAIALSSRTIISGKDTPKRIPKLQKQ